MKNPQLAYRVEKEIQQQFKFAAMRNLQEPGKLIKDFMQAYIDNPIDIQKIIQKYKPQ
jgi:hypothetical protein